MKIKLITIVFILISAPYLNAQNYQIDFTSSGAATTIDNVLVENITQCNTISINGDDILHFVETVGINESNQNSDFSIYPNPMEGFCTMSFSAKNRGYTSIEIIDINGKTIFQNQTYLQKGNHSFNISGISKGMYFIQIKSENYSYSKRFISIAESIKTPKITYAGLHSFERNIKTTSLSLTKDTSKDISSIVQMQYNDGDMIKLTGISGNYKTVVMITPTESQTVNFEFIPCTDANDNHYSIVQIGEQWWMAENLNAGTYVPITTPQAAGTKFCMNINGVDDPSCPMGGLYEWNVLMQESLPCNGTGAPPDDICDTPVQGMCPDGWHIPSHYEWTTLARYSGSDFGALEYNSTLGVGVDEGGNLKMKCTSMWWDPNSGATNATGFSAIPGGDTWDGIFEDFGQSSYFWTSTAIFTYTYNPWVYALNYSVPFVGRSQYFPENGFSCRCIKD